MTSSTAGAQHRRTTLIVPCYNEERRIAVGDFRAFLDASPAVRLVFVDDGSKDNTRGVLSKICEGFGTQATTLVLERNSGKAEAVRRGILHALDHLDQEYVGFWDADLATPLSAVPELVAVLESRRDIEMVFGSRVKLLGRYVQRRVHRHYLGRIFATVVSTMLQLPIYDTQCGAKIFRVDADIRGIFEQPFLSKWIFDVEIIARYLQRYKKTRRSLEDAIYEYPLNAWVDVAGSKVGPTDFVTAFIDVLRIRRAYLR